MVHGALGNSIAFSFGLSRHLVGKFCYPLLGHQCGQDKTKAQGTHRVTFGHDEESVGETQGSRGSWQTEKWSRQGAWVPNWANEKK